MSSTRSARGGVGAARAVCAAGCALLLVAAVGGWATGNQAPTFPPPAANEALQVLRQACTVLQGVVGLATLAWVIRPGVRPLLGIGLQVVGINASTFALAALRGAPAAELLWLPALGCAVTALAILRASSRPLRRRV